MPKADPPSTHQPGSQDEPQRILHAASTAESVLADLESPKNFELRGRTPQRSLERINQFLDSDQLYKGVENCFAALSGNESQRPIFREAVEERLKIFERLATRNDQIDVETAVQHDYRWLYRRLTNEVYGHLLKYGTDVRGPSIYRLDPLTEYARLIDQPTAQDKTTKAPAETPPPSPASTNQAPQASRESPEDLKLFDDFVDFTAGKLTSYPALGRLARELDERLQSPGQSALLPLIQPHLNDATLMAELSRARLLLDECEAYRRQSPAPALQGERLCTLIESFRNNPLYGFARHDPLKQLESEGVLSAQNSWSILEAAQIVRNSPQVVHLAALHAEEQGVLLDNSELRRIDNAVITLQQAGIPDRKLQTPLQVLLARGVEQIEHVENLAELAKLGVPVGDYVNISKGRAAIIADTTQEMREGQYLQCGAAGIARVLKSRFSLARSVPEPILQATADAIAPFKNSVPVRIRQEIAEVLVALGQQSGQENLPQTLRRVCADLACLSRFPDAVSKCRDMFLKPTRSITTLQMIKFPGALTQLHHAGIEGVDRLIRDAHVVWTAEQRGDRSQNLLGFLVEADSLLQLHKLGYLLDKVSTAGTRTQFSFDALGQTPDGRPCGIEIKSNLGTVSRKEKESLEDSQIARFLAACQAEGREPVIAIAQVRPEDSWALTHLSSLLDRIQKELGPLPRPKFINVLSGKEIEL